jgi:hypothetical protein
MKKEFTVRMAWSCNYGDTVLIIANYSFKNEVVCFPMIKYQPISRASTDVGMWKIKTLKK